MYDKTFSIREILVNVYIIMYSRNVFVRPYPATIYIYITSPTTASVPFDENPHEVDDATFIIHTYIHILYIYIHTYTFVYIRIYYVHGELMRFPKIRPYIEWRSIDAIIRDGHNGFRTRINRIVRRRDIFIGPELRVADTQLPGSRHGGRLH